jgi:hypothetical protein
VYTIHVRVVQPKKRKTIIAQYFEENLVRKPEGKRPLGRPRRTWEDNIKMHLIEIGCGGMDWINLVQDRDQWWAPVNTVP